MHRRIHVWDAHHSIFRSPAAVEAVPEVIDAPVPYDFREFKGRWPGGKVPVLNVHRTEPPAKTVPWGYAIYDDGGLADSPDVELICGGVTEKGPAYYSVMRQGNYLLWGFGCPPSDFTPLGDRLFVNCLHYAARFGDDAPLVRKVTDSRKRVPNTIALARLEPAFMWIIERDLQPSLMASTKKDLDALSAWYRENEPYLHMAPSESGKGAQAVDVDPDAKRLKTPNDRVESIAAWISLLDGEQGEAAKGLLARYVPCAACRDKEAWGRWLGENRDYLFFSDSGGFRFFVDERAKKAGVPSRSFRASSGS